MPDSPADVKTQPRSTPPAMPPPPPAVSQVANRNTSYTPTTSKSLITDTPQILLILGQSLCLLGYVMFFSLVSVQEVND